MVLVPLPFSRRPWALPFMTVLAPSKQFNEANNKTHKTSIDWTLLMMKVVSRWLKQSWVLLGDGAYACLELARQCQGNQVTLISRLRLDSQLYELSLIHISEPTRPY